MNDEELKELQKYSLDILKVVDKFCRENNIKYLELTSGNQRRGAHYFYKNKAFKIKDTMVFVKFYN